MAARTGVRRAHEPASKVLLAGGEDRVNIAFKPMVAS